MAHINMPITEDLRTCLSEYQAKVMRAAITAGLPVSADLRSLVPILLAHAMATLPPHQAIDKQREASPLPEIPRGFQLPPEQWTGLPESQRKHDAAPPPPAVTKRKR